MRTWEQQLTLLEKLHQEKETAIAVINKWLKKEKREWAKNKEMIEFVTKDANHFKRVVEIQHETWRADEYINLDTAARETLMDIAEKL